MSKPTVTRLDFQELAAVRLAEARSLLDAELWDGAYYLAGYAVEVGLKACIIKRVQATDAFLDRKFSERCYTHNFVELLELTGLKAVWKAAKVADLEFSKNWKSAIAWSEQKRYCRIRNEKRTSYTTQSRTTRTEYFNGYERTGERAT